MVHNDTIGIWWISKKRLRNFNIERTRRTRTCQRCWGRTCRGRRGPCSSCWSRSSTRWRFGFRRCRYYTHLPSDEKQNMTLDNHNPSTILRLGNLATLIAKLCLNLFIQSDFSLLKTLNCYLQLIMEYNQLFNMCSLYISGIKSCLS